MEITLLIHYESTYKDNPEDHFMMLEQPRNGNYGKNTRLTTSSPKTLWLSRNCPYI